MKWRLESVFKVYVVLLVALLLWSFWASAAETNPPPSTNVIVGADRLNTLISSEQKSYLTFGLDKVEVLHHELFDIPAWQYIASLVYIFLAFIVSKLADWL